MKEEDKPSTPGASVMFYGKKTYHVDPWLFRIKPPETNVPNYQSEAYALKNDNNVKT